MTAPELLRERLTDEQWDLLLRPLNVERVNKLDGNDYLEQWDVRRWLTRIFGFGGWDEESRELTCIREHGVPQEQGGRPTGKWRWWVSYRALTRLTVRDQWGRELAHFDGAAADEKANQPGHGDAHHGAMTSAQSTALKRAAINLGDAFGLSLYVKDAELKRLPVVGWVAVNPPEHMPETAEAVVTAPPRSPNGAQPPADTRTAEQVEADETRAEIRRFATELGWDLRKVADTFESEHGVNIKTAGAEALTAFLVDLQLEAQAERDRAGV